MSRTYLIHLGRRKTICVVFAEDDFLKGWVNAFRFSYYDTTSRITHTNNANQIERWRRKHLFSCGRNSHDLSRHLEIAERKQTAQGGNSITEPKGPGLQSAQSRHPTALLQLFRPEILP